MVISDRRAKTCLVLLGSKLNGTYATYRAEWLKQFDEREQVIEKACSKLIRVKDFPPTDEKDENLASVIGSRWFHERVFDKFLWWNGVS